MTPQEKAKELYNKFRNEFPVMSRNIKGKQCALIAVEEILNLYWNDVNGFVYWNEVKSEIEKL